MKSSKLIGHGPRKVLLFPGLLGTRDAFDQMLSYADLDAFQYAVAEYRGYGQARHERGLYTLRETVIDAVRLAEFLGWDRFAVAGHSLGALVAQMLAVALPNRVDAIVSIAGLGANGAGADPQRVAFMQEAVQSRAGRETLVNSGTGNRYTDGFARAVVASTWNAIDHAALESYALDASRTDIHEHVAESDTPVLVLVGEHDPHCTAAAAHQTTLRWYRNTTLRVLAGSGHYPMYESPPETLFEMERYLGSTASRASEHQSEPQVS